MAGVRRPVLLTVDDNRSVHEVYALAFEPSYDHLRADRGHEALSILQARRVDVVVLDLMMPDLNGMEVLDRALKVTPGLIVVICSVIDASQSALRAIRRGAADYFVKPTEPEVMETVVRQLLAARGEPDVAIPQPTLITRRVLIIGVDPGFRAALTVALQRQCRVDVAPRSSVAIEMLQTMTPDLIVCDLRSASSERLLGLQSLRAKFQKGPMIIVGSGERIGPFLAPSADRAEILVPEPVDFALLFSEIATLLAVRCEGAPMTRLSTPSSIAVGQIVARYTDHALRVSDLTAGSGLSVGHFAHLFSAEMGSPPMEWVVRVRIQAAIFALRETGDKVSTIARRFGFYDGPHLALTLRRRGLGRPGDFRRY